MISVDIGNGTISTPALTRRSKRLAKFLCLLVLDNVKGGTGVSLGVATTALGIVNLDTRYVFHRMIEQLADSYKEDNLVLYENKTTGPWRIEEDTISRISILNNGLPIDSSELQNFFASPHYDVALPVGLDTIGNLEFLDSINRSQFHFLNGDFDAAVLSLSTNTDEHDALMQSLSGSKLLNILIRLEKHNDILNQSKRLKRISANLTTKYIQNYVFQKCELAHIWHAYSKERDYDLTLRRLLAIENDCSQNSALYIDWLNFVGLVYRRKAIEFAKSASMLKNADSMARKCIQSYNASITQSIFFGIDYQTQRTIANLVNAISTFSDREIGGFRVDRDLGLRLVRAMELADEICKNNNIGRDDLYNPIFVMSACRKFDLYKIDWANSDIDLFNESNFRVADFGAFEYESMLLRGENIGSEQLVYLSLEICNAAVEENSVTIYEEFVDVAVLNFWETSTSNQNEIVTRVREIFSHVHSKYFGIERWSRATADLNVIAG